MDKRKPIPLYCDNCKKIVDSLCSAFADVCKHTGADRGGYKGCAFSPMEVPVVTGVKKRVGQQKQKKEGGK